MNAEQVAWILTNSLRSKIFSPRANFVVVPNVSWGFGLNYEADLLVVSKAGFVTEIEIKTSFSDWKNDIKKWKFKYYEIDKRFHTDAIKKFYYAAPLKLAERHNEIIFPEYAGVIGVEYNEGIDNWYSKYLFEILKKPKTNRIAKKVNDKKLLEIARLGSLRSWSEKYNPFKQKWENK